MPWVSSLSICILEVSLGYLWVYFGYLNGDPGFLRGIKSNKFVLEGVPLGSMGNQKSQICTIRVILWFVWVFMGYLGVSL